MKQVMTILAALAFTGVGCAGAPNRTCDTPARDAIAVYGTPTQNQMEVLEDGRLNTGKLIWDQTGFQIEYIVADPDDGYCDVKASVTDRALFCTECVNYPGLCQIAQPSC